MNKKTAFISTICLYTLFTAGCTPTTQSGNSTSVSSLKSHLKTDGERSSSAIFGFKQSCEEVTTSEKDMKHIILTDKEKSFTPATAAILAPIIGFGANYAINYTEKKIDKKKKDLNGQFLSTGIVQNFSSDTNDNTSCIMITRGNFITSENDPWGTITSGDTGYTRQELKWFKKNKFHNFPEFYLLINVVKKNDVAMLEPYKLNYGGTSAKKRGKKKKNVTLALSMSSKSNLSESDINSSDSYATFKHNFGELQIGYSYTKEQLLGTESYNRIKKPKEAVQSAQSEGASNISFATALITESEEPSIALEAMAGAFESKKDDLQKAFEKILSKIAGIDDQDDNSDKQTDEEPKNSKSKHQ